MHVGGDARLFFLGPYPLRSPSSTPKHSLLESIIFLVQPSPSTGYKPSLSSKATLERFLALTTGGAFLPSHPPFDEALLIPFAEAALLFPLRRL